jgi:chromosome partitioning protein
MKHTRVLAVSSRKGGVAKTTTAGAMSSILNSKGIKVLAIDLDGQGNLTNWNGYNTEGKPTVYEVLKGQINIHDAIYHGAHYDLLPADQALFLLEGEIMGAVDRYTKLRKVLKNVDGKYDYIIIDCPPSLGTFTLNAYSVADGIIVTTDASAFATQGMSELSQTVEDVRLNVNANIKVIGILLTRFTERYNFMKVMKDVSDRIAECIDAPVYDTPIRPAVALMEAQLNCTDILEIRNQCNAKNDYIAWVDEFLAREAEERGGDK